MAGKITISNKSNDVAIIDIEGIIGVPEAWQFEEPGERVATYEKFRAVLDELKQLQAKEVVVNIRSTGGNVNDALLIHDTLKELEAEVTTKCFGYVASAATIIAQAASQARREVSSNALYLIHRSVCATEGNAEELTRSLGMLGKSDERIAAVYAARSGKPVEVFSELMAENDGNGRWLDPEETIEYGLADAIIGSEPIASNAVRVIENLGLPPIPNQKMSFVSNVAKHWNAILELLGIATSSEEVASSEVGEESRVDNGLMSEEGEVASNLEATNGVESEVCECTTRVEVSAAEREALVRGQTEIRDLHKSEVAQLENKIAELEAQNARLAVGATQTMSKEDPSAHQEIKTPNEEAYLQDLLGFRA